jgi:hypothetical protein
MLSQTQSIIVKDKKDQLVKNKTVLFHKNKTNERLEQGNTINNMDNLKK